MRTQVTAIVALVVLIALCFSVGEGLRLTPFPVSGLPQVETTDNELGAHASHENPFYSYGPLDVPAQSHQHNKRQAVDFAGPFTGVAGDIPPYLDPTYHHRLPNLVSALFVSRPVGRAPPSIS